MSEAYEKSINITDNVSVEVKNKIVKVKGPHAELTRDFNHAMRVELKIDGNSILIRGDNSRKKIKALVGTIYSHINNMIKGSLGDFKVILKIVYAHFPINVKVEKNLIFIENFLGERRHRTAKIIGKSTKVEVVGDDVIVSGPNIEYVTQTAANITKATKIKNKDPRIFQDGIYKYKKLYNDNIIWELKI
ncbi:MAG: 50S ribosomal protein L6 [Candidatus Helarchaeota archaeon]